MSRWLGDVGAMDEVRSRVAGLYDPFETCRLRKETPPVRSGLRLRVPSPGRSSRSEEWTW
jgi:hypothetical protein